MKASYVMAVIFPLSLGAISAHSKAMCESGENIKKPTVRSFKGILCKIKPIAAWAEKNCANTPGYEASHCHKNAKIVLKNIDITTLPSNTTENAESIGEIVGKSPFKTTPTEELALKKLGIPPISSFQSFNPPPPSTPPEDPPHISGKK